jgi:hypothetical protein
MYSHTFIVQGRGAFPMDMLRYDHCYPADTGGAQLIAESWEAPRPGSQDRAVTLMATTTHKTWEPTKARWNSFGWGVIDVQPGRKV